ncbi:MAG: hypothetical protein DSM107014_04705 [Gomphosphaeria aponina SAG 52.96 = DSM 107014]|uniref:Uncharacterized protein n=1 Tax=Gomphosphaeria aponina SAG 52.96 = DSM 107014 TaxID=1521640 RepID=A0A941GNZ1_9CHRO|nr:hypothetical protein [Gomphosphaeria aponina SAG 52.96 = DSM 107014]
MGNREGFTGGFLAGAVLGGIVGGVLGSLLTARRNNEFEPEKDQSSLQPERGVKLTTEASIEDARLSLEEKISQLNLVIDDVRQQLGEVNSSSLEKE